MLQLDFMGMYCSIILGEAVATADALIMFEFSKKFQGRSGSRSKKKGLYLAIEAFSIFRNTTLFIGLFNYLSMIGSNHKSRLLCLWPFAAPASWVRKMSKPCGNGLVFDRRHYMSLYIQHMHRSVLETFC